MFPTKAIREWKEGDDESHVNLVQKYFKEIIPNGFENVTKVVEESTESDPFFAILGFKL